jgi:hypothetical protein
MTKAGHADMKTTWTYMHMADVAFREEADRLEARLLGVESSTRLSESESTEPDRVTMRLTAPPTSTAKSSSSNKGIECLTRRFADGRRGRAPGPGPADPPAEVVVRGQGSAVRSQCGRVTLGEAPGLLCWGNVDSD